MIKSTLFILLINDDLDYGAKYLTEKKLTNLQEIIHLYEDEFNSPPETIRVLCEYAKHLNINISPYDYYGNKIDIVALTDDNWLIRSYGKNHNLFGNYLYKSKKNWNGDFKISNRPEGLSTYISNPQYLLSNSSYSNKYIARVFSNPVTLKKSLIIVKNTPERELVYLYQTDDIEEFMWLGTSHKIILTSKNHYPIQIIDLDSNSVNKFDVLYEKSSAKKYVKIKPFFSTLAGSIGSSFFILKSTNLNSPLDPRSFFNVDNLFVVTVDEENDIQIERYNTKWRSYDARIKLDDNDYFPSNKSWFTINDKQKLVNTLDKWHKLALQASKEPTYPYMLYHLLTLYESAAAQYGNLGEHKKSLGMYGFASEFARELAKGQNYPTWLRLTGWHAWGRLMKRKPTFLPLWTEDNHILKP